LDEGVVVNTNAISHSLKTGIEDDINSTAQTSGSLRPVDKQHGVTDIQFIAPSQTTA
jgi:hypothetical protein